MVKAEHTLKTGGIPIYEAFFDFNKIVSTGFPEREIYNWFSSRLSNYENLQINISRNEIAFHGLPRNTSLGDNDVFTIDVCGKLDEQWHDSAFTFYTGNSVNISEAINNSCLILKKLIDMLYPGITVSEIGQYMESLCIPYGNMSLIEEAAGHGIGRELHEPPDILFVPNRSSEILRPGNWYCIEPVYSLGENEIFIDHITGEAKTRDLSPTIHTEVMVYCSESEITSPVISNFF